MATAPGLIASDAAPASRYTNRFKTVFWSWMSSVSRFARKSKACEMQSVQIEDYRPGYPRFSALIAAHESFHLCRRFSKLRTRLLLLKQDRLSLLENQLEKIDQEESAVLFLGSSRCDSNRERSSILADIDTALANYDEFVERDHRMLRYENAKSREVLSLQNWVNGNACLAREETAYLTHCKELISIAPTDDGAVTRLESLVEDVMIRFCKSFRKGPCRDMSRDSNVYIFSVSFITQATRTIIASLIIVFMLVPVVVCNVLSGGTPRIIATILFIATLSCLTKARTIEMFVAGATYAAVLTVFISGTNSGTS